MQFTSSRESLQVSLARDQRNKKKTTKQRRRNNDEHTHTPVILSTPTTFAHDLHQKIERFDEWFLTSVPFFFVEIFWMTSTHEQLRQVMLVLPCTQHQQQKRLWTQSWKQWLLFHLLDACLVACFDDRVGSTPLSRTTVMLSKDQTNFFFFE